jgi:hypothetical protein
MGMLMMSRLVLLLLALVSTVYGFGVHTPVFGARASPVSGVPCVENSRALPVILFFPRGDVCQCIKFLLPLLITIHSLDSSIQ